MSPTAIASKKKSTAAASSSSKPSAPADMEQVELDALRESLGEYRTAVADAADGKQHDASEMNVIRSAMRDIGIPAYAWARDIEARRKMRSLNASLDELLEAQGKRDIEAQQLDAEIQQIKRRLAEANARRHELVTVAPMTISNLSTRIGQTRTEHPHLFHSVEDVVRHRVAENAKRAAAASAPQTGWEQKKW